MVDAVKTRDFKDTWARVGLSQIEELEGAIKVIVDKTEQIDVLNSTLKQLGKLADQVSIGFAASLEGHTLPTIEQKEYRDTWARVATKQLEELTESVAYTQDDNEKRLVVEIAQNRMSKLADEFSIRMD